MRVAIDTRGINHVFKGGVNEYTISLLNELFSLKKKARFDLLTSGIDPSNRRAVKRLFPYPNTTIRTINIPNKILNTSILTLKEPKLESFGGAKSDILFMPNINTLAKRRKTPLVLTFHDISYALYSNFFSRNMRIWHTVVQPRSLAREADVIIAVSESTKQDLVEMYQIHPEKIRVIYPGTSQEYGPLDIHHPVQEPILKAIRQKYHLPESFLLYLGTLEPRKNVKLLIEAFTAIAGKYREVDLVIAGKKGWLYQEVLSKAKTSPFAHRIHFTGFIDERDKPYLYNLAKIFVYPSYYEGFGFPVVEAMSCGIPTITSNISSLPEITKGQAITISPYNVHELIWSLEQLLSDQRLYQEYVLRSGSIRATYQWRRSAIQTYKIFEELI